MGAAAGDAATVSTAFNLSNGVFARVFPLAPAPLIFAGLAAVLWPGNVLPNWLSRSAFVVAALFEMAGIAAIFGSAGPIFAMVMSIAQEFWILAAAFAFWRSSGARSA